MYDKTFKSKLIPKTKKAIRMNPNKLFIIIVLLLFYFTFGLGTKINQELLKIGKIKPWFGLVLK